jgi:Na+-transporting methylmalonyl-CoA/oxaloacetate decarboxylase gamma subunit
MDAETLKATADLANALSQFKTSMFIALCFTLVILGVGGTFIVLWFRRAMAKDRDRLEDHQKDREAAAESGKQVRAELFTKAQLKQSEAVAKLAASIGEMKTSQLLALEAVTKAITTVTTTLEDQSGALRSITDVVAKLSDKIENKLPPAISRRLIHSKLASDMFRNICGVIERSFVENHFVERREFVTDKVRSRIRDCIIKAREELLELPLSVNINEYFLTTDDESGERFVLCDTAWVKISVLFADQRSVEVRMEEVRLILENLIQDLIGRVAKKGNPLEALDYSPRKFSAASAALPSSKSSKHMPVGHAMSAA